MPGLELASAFQPAGDQPRAIEELVAGLQRGERHQVLLGVTGSGKTFTIAKVLERVQRPALVIAHNKTLAGQLYAEFREFFPGNAVCFFVSYYDYYQPEAYIPQSDTYIEKDAAINDEIDRLRHVATHALLTRRDVIIVASVSCIFGLGPVENYGHMRVDIACGQALGRDQLLRRLVEIHYNRNDIDFHRGTFRVRGEVVDIFPVYEEERALRVSFWGDEVESIHLLDPLRGRRLEPLEQVAVYPGSHYVTGEGVRRQALQTIAAELEQRLEQLRAQGRLLEAQRLEQRTNYDLEMLEQMGYCHGVENYSRHLSGRRPGEPPATLIEYLPGDTVVVIDESHQTLPQIKGMVRGDRSRKQTLVEHGFRLPSALDNRPLSYEEFAARVGQCIYVSATPAEFEIGLAGGVLVEQINRPTGLLDPQTLVRPAASQVEDVLGEISRAVAAGQRVLVTTLTKRLAEELTDHLEEQGIRARYLHSDIDTLQRLAIVRDLRRGEFDVLVGINLLREGLDIPEVALVAVLDADREGFLRSATALVQTAGRAARHLEGRVIFYAERMTPALQQALDETQRRRRLQERFNREHGIEPRSIVKALPGPLPGEEAAAATVPEGENVEFLLDEENFTGRLAQLERQMRSAAEALEFERAAELRDRIKTLKQWRLRVS
ncbi:MAG: excinuclease ABC subunit B [Deltaproteobacteria bacterium]|nr:MAG: excinuclease ABC subunit B [Deltaproteobacteria bacterium]